MHVGIIDLRMYYEWEVGKYNMFIDDKCKSRCKDATSKV